MKDINEIQKGEELKIKTIKTDALTLNPDEQKINLSFNEPAFGKMNFLKKDDEGESAGSVDESMLSEEEKQQVEEFVKQINVADIKMVNSYGANAQRKISTFSTAITETVTTKEFGDVGNSLRELRAAISSTTVQEKREY